MPTSISFNPTDSVKIQAKLDIAKANPATVHFNAGDYLITSQIKFYSNTVVTADSDAVFTLTENAPISIFGEQAPVFTQKTPAITGLNISGLIYRGNYLKQGNTPNDHGLGYGNIFGFTNISNSQFSGLDLGEGEGDGFRIKNGDNLLFSKIAAAKLGHDAFHLNKSNNIKIQGCNIKLRTNNAVRGRGTSNFTIIDNEFDGSVDKTYAPAIQLENQDSGAVTENVQILNNKIHDTFGPAVWGLAKLGPAGGVTIKGNNFANCGNMPAANKIAGVGGVVIDGYTRINITANEIKNCSGYGVLFGDYLDTSTLKGLTGSVTGNIISGTKKSNYAGKVSGTAIANLARGRYTLVVKNNTLSGNLRDYYL